MRSPDEIKKGLECCTSHKNMCIECPYCNRLTKMPLPTSSSWRQSVTNCLQRVSGWNGNGMRRWLIWNPLMKNTKPLKA